MIEKLSLYSVSGGVAGQGCSSFGPARSDLVQEYTAIHACPESGQPENCYRCKPGQPRVICALRTLQLIYKRDCKKEQYYV
ncbi:MAG: hypothetical protein CSA32_03795 [Desulfobulbus propionicus]|nr:MAG: hypothetical protein CSA32_03795 [Desulfobulbus propionicus]